MKSVIITKMTFFPENLLNGATTEYSFPAPFPATAKTEGKSLTSEEVSYIDGVKRAAIVIPMGPPRCRTELPVRPPVESGGS